MAAAVGVMTPPVAFFERLFRCTVANLNACANRFDCKSGMRSANARGGYGGCSQRFLRVRRCGFVAGAQNARVMNGTSSLMTSSVFDGLQRPLENAAMRCGPAAV
jgi:hypothetical protein